MLCCCPTEETDDKLDLTNMGQIDIIDGGEIIEDYRYNNKNMYIILKNNKRFFIKEAFYNKETQNELFFIKKLNHENIIEFVNEQIKNNNYCLIAMEYFPMDLYSYINTIKKPMHNDSIDIIYRQLTNVIKYLHGIYVCHGDIKLENIMVEPSDLSIKLIDFEYTRQYQSNDILTKENIGTFYYRSPESLLFTDNGYNPFKSEIWALGICLFILNEYRYPYFPDFRDMMTRRPNRDVISDEFNKKPNYVATNDRWRSILDTMLVIEPKHRG